MNSNLKHNRQFPTFRRTSSAIVFACAQGIAAVCLGSETMRARPHLKLDHISAYTFSALKRLFSGFFSLMCS